LDGYKGIRTNIQSAADDFRIYDTRTDAKETNNLAGSSGYFSHLQNRMKSRILQIRRPDTSAVRPYDTMHVPPLDSVQNTGNGLTYQVFETATFWTPDISSLSVKPAKTGVTQNLDLSIRSRDEDIVIGYTGLLEVPATGEYTIYLQTDRGAVLRLHEATLLDADKNYKSGSEVSASILLKKGHHPIKLTYARGKEGTPLLQVQWSGPGLSKQTIDSQQLFHLNQNAKAGL
jgi:hypothetical protein